MKASTRVVVVGGGVVGVGIAYGLAARGCADVVLCEQHELTSGSTWHAAGLVQKYTHDRFRATIVSKSIEIYESLEAKTGQAVGWHRCGSLRIATTEDRADEFRKYMDRAASLGLPATFISRDEALELWPLLSRGELITAAIHNPDDGHIAPADVTMAMAAGARLIGVEVNRGVGVTGFERTVGGEWRVMTTAGDIVCEHVVLATGMYARESGARLGLNVPAVPIVHQYMVSEPIAALSERKDLGLPELPILKADRFNAYFREERGGLLFGPYEAGKDLELFADNGVPEGFVGALLPPKLEPVESHIEAAIEMVPAFGEVGIRSNVRGPINLTPDGRPMLGPAPQLPNVWLAEGFSGGPTMGGGVGFYLARWILEGDPGMDMLSADPRRYSDFATKRYAAARNRETFGNNFGVHYPDYQLTTARGVRRFPVHDALARVGAVWGSEAGWELPMWFAPKGTPALDQYSFRRANYFAQVGEECQAVRNAVGLMNLSHLAKYEVWGPGAERYLDWFLANRLPSKTGRMRLCHHLTEHGHIAAEYTVLRLSRDRFYLCATSRLQRHHFDLLSRFAPHDASVQLRDVTGARGVLALAGPNAREVLRSLTDIDLSPSRMPWLTACFGEVAWASDVYVVRASYVGELGFELHHPIEYQASLYESLLHSGEELGLHHVGSRAIESLRLDKSYRAMVRDLGPQTSPVDAGMQRFIATDKGDFSGRAAYLVRQQTGPTLQFAVLDVEPGDADAIGEEAIYTDDRVVGAVASGGYSHTLGRLLVHAYLPPELVKQGAELTVSVLMQRRRARIVAESPYDPTNQRQFE